MPGAALPRSSLCTVSARRGSAAGSPGAEGLVGSEGLRGRSPCALGPRPVSGLPLLGAPHGAARGLAVPRGSHFLPQGGKRQREVRGRGWRPRWCFRDFS